MHIFQKQVYEWSSHIATITIQSLWPNDATSAKSLICCRHVVIYTLATIIASSGVLELY